MKNFVRVGVMALLLVTCVAEVAVARRRNQASNEAEERYGYTKNASVIEQKKREFLDMSSRTDAYYFSKDKDLESQDPNAFWVMNRLMATMRQIETADDAWAWVLAMNTNVEEYNRRLNRKIGKPESAMMAVEELISIYGAGNQPQINTCCYVESIVAHYLTVLEYYRTIEYSNDQMQRLYYREYSAWFDLNNAINGLMYFYTYAGAGYSAAPMELNYAFEVWSEERLKELKIEEALMRYRWTPYTTDAEPVSVSRFNELLNFYKNVSRQQLVESFVKVYGDATPEGYKYAASRVASAENLEKTKEMVRYYEKAIASWRTVREQIARALPEEKRDSYRAITRQIHTRLYNDLLKLKEPHY